MHQADEVEEEETKFELLRSLDSIIVVVQGDREVALLEEVLVDHEVVETVQSLYLVVLKWEDVAEVVVEDSFQTYS